MDLGRPLGFVHQFFVVVTSFVGFDQQLVVHLIFLVSSYAVE